MVGTATSASLTHVSTTTETETRNKTHNMLTSTENVPPSTASVELEDEAVSKETSWCGRLKNVPKWKIIGECVCGNPVTVEEMDDEEKTICCKRKGCETSWVSQLGCTCQLWLTHKLCSIVFYAQASQVSSEGFQGGFASCASSKRSGERVKGNKRRREVWRCGGSHIWTLWCNISIFRRIFPRPVS